MRYLINVRKIREIFVFDIFSIKRENISFNEDGLLKGYNRSVSHQTNMSPFYEVKK